MLVLSRQNWCELYRIPDDVEVYCCDTIDDITEKIYDIAFIDRSIKKRELDSLRKVTKAYTVFYTEDLMIDHHTGLLLKSRKAQLKKVEDIQPFFDLDIKNFFSEPYGEKSGCDLLLVNSNFDGDVSWSGMNYLELNGTFGDDYKQVAYWKRRIPIYKNQCLEFYLEYEKEGDVSIQLEISQYMAGFVDRLLKVHSFNEEQLKDLVLIDNEFDNTACFISIKAKGKGKIRIKSLHDRYSRRGHGNFLPGGERYVASSGEEVFAYFDPGDMKPPLNVYFSGYKTREGFEGYYMMKKFGGPFLLLSEARLQGGAFYFGDEEYERMFVDIIKAKVSELGFLENDVILAGLSMGTTGALYFACDLKPHAVILGKPLASIGRVAKNESSIRPGGFPTALDVVSTHAGGMLEENIDRLNNRMWDKIRKSDFSNTVFAIAYMIEDDYDDIAYRELIDNLSSTGVIVYGKGLHGRHNDSTGSIVAWFVERFKSILREDYKRDI